MIFLLAAALSFASGLAQAEKAIEVSVETFDVVIDKPRPAQWVVHRGVAPGEEAALIAAASQSGAACHELEEENVVVCYKGAYQPNIYGMDWQKLSQSYKP